MISSTPKEALKGLVRSRSWGTNSNRLGIVLFGSSAINEYTFDLRQDTASLISAINGIPFPKGLSFIKDAVHNAINMFDSQGRPGAQKTLVLFTDGKPNPAVSQSPCTLADDLDSRGVDVKLILNGVGASTGAISCLIGSSADATPIANVNWNNVVSGAPRNLVWRASYNAGMNYQSSATVLGSVTVNTTTHQIQWNAGNLAPLSSDSLVLTFSKGTATGKFVAFTKDTLYYSFTSSDTTHARLSLGDVQATVGPCDLTPAVVTPIITGTQGVNPWYVSDVHLVWSITDPEGGVLGGDAGCANAVDINADTPGTDFTCTGRSLGGATTTTVTIKRDATRPVIKFAGNLTSYKDNESVAITCTASDATSGIDAEHTSCADYNAAPHTLALGRHEVVATATDVAGNTTADTTRFEITSSDVTPPVIVANLNGTPGLNGWYTTSVGVTWTLTDLESAISSTNGCDPTSVQTDTPLQEVSCSATSFGGTSSQTASIKVDRAAPIITFSGVQPSFKDNQTIAIGCTAVDATSGVDPTHTSCETYNAAPHSLTIGMHKFVAYATDFAGNMMKDSVQFEVIPSDVTPPSIVPSVSGTLGQNGWYTSGVSISWLVTDAESEVSSSNGCGPVNFSADTDGETVTCSATSYGGTASADATVKIDRTAPVVAFSGNAGTYAASATVHITCSAADAMSGVAASTCADLNIRASSLSVGTHTLNASATDKAGNSGSASATFTVTVDATSLSAVIDQIVGDSNVANGLHAKLDAIAKGNAKNKTNLVNAFTNQVEAQRGKKLSNADADLLIRLAASL